MIAVNDTDLCKNVNSYMNKVTENEEAMIVVRGNNQNIVMLSEESYNNLIENVYVMGNKANYDWLMQSKAQLEQGNIITKQLIEVDTDE
jgi:antitoxin YefM